MTLAERSSVPNRWLIAVAAVVMQICLGAVYGYSVFIKPIMALGHWSETQVATMFTMAILFLGLACAVGGFWQDRVGPRIVALTGGVLYGLGYLLAAYGVSVRSIALIILGYGVIGGTGNGLGYITPVATLVKWFPDKRGVMTGLAVAGFGFGAVLMTQFVNFWMPAHGVGSTLLCLGIIYGVVVCLTALTYQNPPAGWQPEGWSGTAANQAASARNYTPQEAFRTWAFWSLWLMLFLNVSAGIMIISTLKPLATETVGMASAAATSMVGLMGLFNGGGRLFWAWVSDRIGRAHVFALLYGIQVVAFLGLLVTRNVALFALICAVIYLCYGGGFGTMPSFTADYFGPKFVGTIYGVILIAWGVGGVGSPYLIAYLHETTGGYGRAIMILAVVMLFSLVLPLTSRPPDAVPRQRAAV